MRVYLAIIRHKYGVEVIIAESQHALTEVVYDYVVESWGEILNGTAIPRDHGKAIETYFAAWEGSSEGETIEYQDQPLISANYVSEYQAMSKPEDWERDKDKHCSKCGTLTGLWAKMDDKVVCQDCYEGYP